MIVNEINIEKSVISTQCVVDGELWIYLASNKEEVQMYCNGREEEKKVRYNILKMALKFSFVKSKNDFWKRIKDVSIREIREEGDKKLLKHYALRYEFTTEKDK